MTTDLRLPEPTKSPTGKPSALPRVAALPGAERRILRKRLEWPLKVMRKLPQAARRGSR